MYENVCRPTSFQTFVILARVPLFTFGYSFLWCCTARSKNCFWSSSFVIISLNSFRRATPRSATSLTTCSLLIIFRACKSNSRINVRSWVPLASERIEFTFWNSAEDSHSFGSLCKNPSGKYNFWKSLLLFCVVKSDSDFSATLLRSTEIRFGG